MGQRVAGTEGAVELAPVVSDDEREIFFASNRATPNDPIAHDIYTATRGSPTDPFATPVMIGTISTGGATGPWGSRPMRASSITSTR
jgi:hypothetical protein